MFVWKETPSLVLSCRPRILVQRAGFFPLHNTLLITNKVKYSTRMGLWLNHAFGSQVSLQEGWMERMKGRRTRKALRGHSSERI